MTQKPKPVRKSRTVVINTAVLAAIIIASQLIEILLEKHGKWLAGIVAAINIYLRFKTTEPVKAEIPKWLKKTIQLGTTLSERKK